MKKFGYFLIGVAVLAACQPNPDVNPLPESQFRMIADYEIAEDIAQNCARIQLLKTRFQIDREVDVNLRASGLSQSEINEIKRQAAARWERKYKEAYANVVPLDRNDPDYFCKYGDYEIARRSAVGLLLGKA